MDAIGCYNKINKSVFVAVCLGSIMISCATKPPAQPSENVSTYSVYESSPETIQSILFLGFTLVERAEKDSVYITMKEFSEGHIIERSEIQKLSPGDIQIDFLNYSGNIVKNVLVKDPTRQEVEIFTQAGEVEGVIIEEKRVDFFVRINFDPEIQIIKLYRQSSGGELALIFATQITRS